MAYDQKLADAEKEIERLRTALEFLAVKLREAADVKGLDAATMLVFMEFADRARKAISNEQ